MHRERRRAAALGGLIAGSLLLFGPGAGGAADTGPQLQAIGRSVQDVDLRWTPAPADGCGTTIWRDGAPLATLCGSASTFIDTAVEPGTRYRYQVVTAAPGAGPAVSNEVTLTTPSLPEGPDVTPPSRAADLQALASDAGVLLSWQSASDDTDVSAVQGRGATAWRSHSSMRPRWSTSTHRGHQGHRRRTPSRRSTSSARHPHRPS